MLCGVHYFTVIMHFKSFSFSAKEQMKTVQSEFLDMPQATVHVNAIKRKLQ